ncbi:DcaP family trimeric outer membrane transporter [Noviherbaspirillum sp. UKPF54]|uniref:DcaP family trimeric outer membrane transporter n=1 Tax=Noviherbaspirillum sp. UKPF54 TaxID=2601898 RepID=UPI001FED67FD|nr:DcaP family trimeric outer membrane transporter [Noviherbaspirillum sp. UKPF54]
MKYNRIVAALAAAGFGLAPVAHAASDAERINQLEKQLKMMQEQIEALKANKASAPVSAQEFNDLKDQVSAQGKEAVVAGDIPGSFRVPGSETSIRVYGIAELNMVHETKGDNGKNDYSTFMPYMPLRGTADAQRSGGTYLHARTSRIGIEGAQPSSFGQIGFKIEGDFNNDPRTGNSQQSGSIQSIYTQQQTNSYDFRLRHAYAQVGGWLFGQTWSTFMDIDNTPETVDFNGPIGSTFIRQPMVRYTYVTPQYGNFTAAVENSVSYVLDPTGTATDAGFAKTPDLIARWDKPFDWGSLSLRAVTTEHRVNGAMLDGSGGTTNVDASRRGWGVAASGQIKTVGDDFISWIVTGGNGIGRYFNYIEGAGFNLANNRIEMERALGVVLGYQRKFNEQFRMNFVYGYQKNYDNGYTDWARANGLDSGTFGVNRYIKQAHIGGFWNPIKQVEIGAEYIYGKRETLSGQQGDMSRINLLARYYLN